MAVGNQRPQTRSEWRLSEGRSLFLVGNEKKETLQIRPRYMKYYNEAERVTFSIKPSICKEDDTECTLENIYQKESEDWKGQECAGEMLEHWPSGGKALACSPCQFPGCQYSHWGRCRGTKVGKQHGVGKRCARLVLHPMQAGSSTLLKWGNHQVPQGGKIYYRPKAQKR